MEAHRSECVQVDNTEVWVPPEMVVGVKLQHPHLVRCFKYAVAMHAAPDKPGGGLLL